MLSIILNRLDMKFYAIWFAGAAASRRTVSPELLRWLATNPKFYEAMI